MGTKLHIDTSATLPEGFDPSRLTWHEVCLSRVDYSPRTLGYPYDTWDAYYDANPYMKPEYCECCGQRV